MTTSNNVLAEVVRMLVAVVGEDFLLDVEVGRETTFTDDLALESIEFVALGEALQRHYGGRVDFAGFVAGMSLDEITAMTVGDLVDHIESRLSAPVG
jgi:acyl carrier protein